MRRIGISISSEFVSAVLVHNGKVEWTAATEAVTHPDLRTAVDDVLAKLPKSTWPNPRVYATFGPPFAYTKIVSRMPDVSNPRILAKIIASMPQRFFIQANGPVITTGVRVVEPSVVQVAALLSSSVDAVIDACRGWNLRVALFTSTDVTLARAGDAGGDASTFAIGATLMDRRESIVYRPKHVLSPRVKRNRTIVAVVGIAVCLGLAIVAPIWRAERAEARAKATIRTLAKRRVTALNTKRELDDIASTIAVVASFEQERNPTTLLLAQLSASLPGRAAVTAFRSDSGGVTAVVLAPHAADVVRAIGEIPGAGQIEIVGPVTREMIGAVELERVTLHVRIRADTGDRRQALALVPDAPDKISAEPVRVASRAVIE